MKLERSRPLFFGCKIDTKLREALAQAKPNERRYFEDPESAFLRICQLGEERWIGKVVDAGVGVAEVEDIQRNVISILRRIAPDVRPSTTSVKIFAIDPDAARDEPERAEELAEEQGGGPYIAD